MNILFSHAARLRKKTEKQLEQYNHPSAGFFLLISLAAAIASLGLILNSTAVIIGAMLVAPLVTPIFGFALSLILLKGKEIGKSLLSILLGTLCAVLVSMLIGQIILYIEKDMVEITNEIIIRTQPNILYFLVALFSGIAGAYAYAKPKIIETVTGIAISVAIIPPLCVTGLNITMENWNLSAQSFSLYLINLAGIYTGSIIVFLILGFGSDVKKNK